MTKAGTASDKFDYKKHMRWYECRPYPGWMGVVFHVNPYRKMLKRDQREDWKDAPWITSGAATINFTSAVRNTPFYIIQIDPYMDFTSPSLVGLLAHEVTHVVQQLWTDIGELYPGREAESYLTQDMLQFVYYNYKLAHAKYIADKALVDPVNLTQE